MHELPARLIGPLYEGPFTPEQVELLNVQQHGRRVHPVTCRSGNRKDANHLDNEGILVATVHGWMCPYCDYRQGWVESVPSEHVPS